MRLSAIRLVAILAGLFLSLNFNSVVQAQTLDAAAVARGDATFRKLGCDSCHGQPGGAGRRQASDLANSAIPRIQDGGKTLFGFMTDKTKGHPDLNGRPAAGVRAIAPVSQAEAADMVAFLGGAYARVRGEKGRAEAPAIIAAAATPCKLTDAFYVLRSADRKTKTVSDAYELACEGGLGRVLIRTVADGKTSYETQDCLAASAVRADGTLSQLACALPANRNLAGQLAPYLDQAGVTCDPQQARGLGSDAAATYVEVACAGDRGYLLGLPPSLDPAKAVTSRNCLALPQGSSTECTLRPREAMLAAATAPLLAGAGAACEPKARRYVARSQGDEYYEIACASGVGFMLAGDFRGGFKTKVACANAEGIAGGCTLTDAKAVQTTDNARYAGLAKAAGYPCAVSGYRPIDIDAGGETVELTCGDRPDGALALFPKTGRALVFTCPAAQTLGYRCALTPEAAAYPRLTAAVKTLHPASTCQVASASFLGVTPTDGYVEVACADKDPGYVLQYAKATAQPTGALYCSQLRPQYGVTCGLPSNLAKPAATPR